MSTEDIAAYTVVAHNNEFHFNVDNPEDLIQRHFVRGELYEEEELQILGQHSEGCRVYYDVGANVGNHSLYMAKVLRASRVYSFEANERASNLLKLNVCRNGLEDVIDTSHTGVGIGRKAESRRVFNPQTNNLGAARLRKPTSDQLERGGYFSEVEVVSIDSLELPELPDFVKIDVEGMELDVLAGMTEVIAASRPRMFIEVNNDKRGAFLDWVAANSYVVADTFSRYDTNMNFMIVPNVRGAS